MVTVNVKVEKTYEISDQFIIDAIIDPAGYGVKYWANWADIDPEARTYTVEDQFGDFSAKVISFDALAQALVDIAYTPYFSGV